MLVPIFFTFIVTFIAVLFGNVFTIINPFIINDYSTGIWTIIAPIIFGVSALVIYEVHNKD